MAEKEYIERETAVCIALGAAALGNTAFSDRFEIAARLRATPAADVRPVVRGRWIRHYEQADTGEDIITYPCGWICSECGRWESEDEPFCNCGAVMEGS